MTTPLRIVLHAPSAESLRRARRNAGNLRQSTPDASVRIIVNNDGVSAALDDPDDVADAQTHVCPTTLARLGREAKPPLTVMATGAILEIVRLQAEGWTYVRA
jgi:uncharacterized protein